MNASTPFWRFFFWIVCLLCFIGPILGNRYEAKVSSVASQQARMKMFRIPDVLPPPCELTVWCIVLHCVVMLRFCCVMCLVPPRRLRSVR